MTVAGDGEYRALAADRMVTPRLDETRIPGRTRINFLLVIIGQMLPAFFPFDPLAFGLSVRICRAKPGWFN